VSYKCFSVFAGTVLVVMRRVFRMSITR